MKHSFLIFFTLCFLNLNIQAQAKWNCGGPTNSDKVVAFFDGATQTLTITGAGKMCSACHPWDILREGIKTVKINEGITSIPEYAFSNFINLNIVTIANSVTEIGFKAFEGTANLHKIDIPNSVTNIGSAAFQGSGIENITLSQNIKSVGHSTFNDCKSLKKADLSKTKISRIDGWFFEGCVQLEDVLLPQNLTSFSTESIFDHCKSLRSITCYNSTPLDISYRAFFGVDLSKVTLYVPEASIVVYKFSNVWKEFGKIEVIPVR